jgi:hypothetical protein
MASEPQVEEVEDLAPSRAPQPVEGGTEHLESLGRLVDNLMGVSRLRERIRRESEGLFLRDDEMPDDPPPTEAPPPVPGGTEDVTKGAKPNTERR